MTLEDCFQQIAVDMEACAGDWNDPEWRKKVLVHSHNLQTAMEAERREYELRIARRVAPR